MKKTVVTTLTLILFISSSALSQSNEAQEAYLKATTAPSLNQKIQLLEDYIQKYKGKGTQYENYAYAHLCIYSLQANQLNKAIEYGENALSLGGLDDDFKCQVYLTLSIIYTKLGKNLEKAKNYSMQVVEIARVKKDNASSTTSPEQWKKLLGAGYYTHAQAQEKAKQLKGAVSSYIKSYDYLKNRQIGNDLKKAGKSLYEFKFYNDAERAFGKAYNILKDFDSCSFYAKSLYKNRKKEEALTYFKKSYGMQKRGEIAFNIGIILAGKAKKKPSFYEEAIRYLLDASFLSPANSDKAMKLAEGIFYNSKEAAGYNKKVKQIQELGKKLEEMTEIFNENFGDKNEEDLSESEKKEIASWLADIEALQAKIKKTEKEQNLIVAKFNNHLEEAKKRLGIK